MEVALVGWFVGLLLVVWFAGVLFSGLGFVVWFVWVGLVVNSVVWFVLGFE